MSADIRPDASDDWRELALCRQSDADYWFPETTGNSATHTLAKRICEQCPVIEQCLQFALDNNERYGIWGGKSEHQRARLKSERRSGVRMHGTRGAYLRHLRRGDVPCDACKAAHTEYTAKRRRLHKELELEAKVAGR